MYGIDDTQKSQFVFISITHGKCSLFLVCCFDDIFVFSALLMSVNSMKLISVAISCLLVDRSIRILSRTKNHVIFVFSFSYLFVN